MALIGSIAINAKVVTTQFAKGVGEMRLLMMGLSKDTAKTSNLIAGAFVAATTAAAGAMAFKMVKAATALGEQTDRARIAFGIFSKDVIAQSELMGTAFGTNKSEFIQTASAMGQIFQGAGYDAEQAKDLSIHFVKLANDLTSYAHIPVEEALFKIQAGLVGQVRPLREVGVLMSEEAIKAYAAAHGIAKLGTELTEAQKVQARVGFITESLAKAQGNLALTADSVANQTRSLSGRLENLAATIGTALLPIVGSALSELQVDIEALSMAWQDWTAGAVNSQVGVVGAVGETAQSFGWLHKAVGFVADAWQVWITGVKVGQAIVLSAVSLIVSGIQTLASATIMMVQSVLSAFSTLAEHIPGIGESIKGAIDGASGSLDAMNDRLKLLSDSLHNSMVNQWGEAKAAITAPWNSEAIDKYFKDAQERIKAARVEASKAGVDVTKITPANAPTAAAKLEAPKFASAAVKGSAEATNAILRARYGGGARSNAAEQTAKNTAQTNEILQKIAGAMGATAFQGARKQDAVFAVAGFGGLAANF